MYLLEIGNNLLAGQMPESLALLMFGSSLIAFAVGLRWVFRRREEDRKIDIELNRTAANG